MICGLCVNNAADRLSFGFGAKRVASCVFHKRTLQCLARCVGLLFQQGPTHDLSFRVGVRGKKTPFRIFSHRLQGILHYQKKRNVYCLHSATIKKKAAGFEISMMDGTGINYASGPARQNLSSFSIIPHPALSSHTGWWAWLGPHCGPYGHP